MRNSILAAALAGQGVALCPLAIVADDIGAGRLVQLSDTSIRADFGYYVLVAADSAEQRAPAIEAFRAWLLSTAHQP